MKMTYSGTKSFYVTSLLGTAASDLKGGGGHGGRLVVDIDHNYSFREELQ
jgi:hypothetical protein